MHEYKLYIISEIINANNVVVLYLYMNKLCHHFYTGSLLHIKCVSCQEVNLIPTGKRHGRNICDVNSKLSAGNLYFKNKQL